METHRRRRLLLINTVVNSGSTGRITEQLGMASQAEGWDCLVAYGRTNNNSALPTYKIGSSWDSALHGILTRVTDRHGLGSRTATIGLIRRIEQYKPDIVHVHNIHGYYLNYEILFEFLRSIAVPIVWTLHDCWPFTGHCAHFEFVNCHKWKTHCHRCPQVREYPKSLGVDNSNDNHSRKMAAFSNLENLTIVTPSDWLSKLVGDSFLRNYPVNVINNGVDMSLFKQVESDLRRKHKLQSKKIILAVASTWSERKGLNFLSELSDSLAEEESLVVIGLSNSQAKALSAAVVSLPRTESILELASWYSTANVLVNLTLEDNFPTVNIESQACGTPVVTFDSGGSRETILPGCGGVVARGNIDQLLSTCRELFETQTVESRSVCSLAASNRFSMAAFVSAYLELYARKAGT